MKNHFLGATLSFIQGKYCSIWYTIHKVVLFIIEPELKLFLLKDVFSFRDFAALHLSSLMSKRILRHRSIAFSGSGVKNKCLVDPAEEKIILLLLTNWFLSLFLANGTIFFFNFQCQD